MLLLIGPFVHGKVPIEQNTFKPQKLYSINRYSDKRRQITDLISAKEKGTFVILSQDNEPIKTHRRRRVVRSD
jgi:hypothetical protein